MLSTAYPRSFWVVGLEVVHGLGLCFSAGSMQGVDFFENTKTKRNEFPWHTKCDQVELCGGVYQASFESNRNMLWSFIGWRGYFDHTCFYLCW